MTARAAFLGGFTAVVVETFTIGAFLSRNYSTLESLSTLNLEALFCSGWLFCSLTTLRLLFLPIAIRGGGHCAVSVSSRTKGSWNDALSGEGGTLGPPASASRCCDWRRLARALPVLWLWANALVLAAASILLTVDQNACSGGEKRRLALLLGAGGLATIAQAIALRALRLVSRRGRTEERHIFLEAILGVKEGRRSEAEDADHFPPPPPEWLGRLQDRVSRARAQWSEKLNQLGDALSSAIATSQSSSSSSRNTSQRQDSSQQSSESNGNGLLARLLSLDVNTVAPGLLPPEDARMARQRAGSTAGIFETASRLLFQHPTSGSTLLLSEDDALFAHLLALFAADNPVVVGTHLVALDAHDPLRLRAYIPQLLTFLLFGAEGEIALQVQEWVLSKCSIEQPDLEESVLQLDLFDDSDGGASHTPSPTRHKVDSASVCHFAHACVWFLEAYVLDTNKAAKSAAAGSNSLVPQLTTTSTATMTDMPRPSSTPNLTASLPSSDDALSASWSAMNRYSLSSTQIKNDRSYSHGGISGAAHDAVVRLLVEIHRRGGSAAIALLHDGPFSNTNPAGAAHDRILIPGDHESMHQDFFQVTAVDPCSEPEHTNLAPNHDKEAFGAALNFIDLLTGLGQDLILVPRAERNEALRAGLRKISETNLPHNAVYIPIQRSVCADDSIDGKTARNDDGCRHRVFALHPEESFAFSTKVRVPYLCCVEVIDYALAAKQLRQRDLQRHESKSKEVERDKNIRWNSWLQGSSGGGQEQPLQQRRNSWSSSAEFSNKAPTTKEQGGDMDNGDWADAALTSPRTLGQWCSQWDHGFSPSQSAPSSYTPPVLGSEGDSMRDATSRSNDGNLEAGTMKPRSNTAPVDFAWNPASSTSESTFREDQSQPIDHSEEGTSQPTAAPVVAAAAETASPVAAPPEVIFKEPWALKEERLRLCSPIGHHLGWRLLPVIIKSNDDLRQEALVAQLIAGADRILRAPGSGCEEARLRPYSILATSRDAGVIEAVPDTVSIDALKRNDPTYVDLLSFFQRHFRDSSSSSLTKSTPSFETAQANFIISLAPYCVICYLLQLKDRHNGNILLDSHGYIVHIDFGFLFLSSPGGNLNFESAPFKLTDEMVVLMGGMHSRGFAKFRRLCESTYLALRRHAHQLTLLVDMMIDGHADLPCWQGQPTEAARAFQERFQPQMGDAAAAAFMTGLIDAATNNWRTTYYDRYQRCCLGIF